MASHGFSNKSPQVLRYQPQRGTTNDDWTDPDDFRGTDTIQFFCDCEAADDSGTGLTTLSPKKTSPAILALVRAAQIANPGQPNQVLFKVSSTGTYLDLGILTTTGLSGGAPLEGRSATQRVVFGSYGVGERAVFRTGTATPIITPANTGSSPNGIKNIAILGLEFDLDGFVPGSNSVTCISILGSISNVLVENCKFKSATWGITMGVTGPWTREEITVRRNVFVDGYVNFIRLIGTNGVLIEGNYFDNMIVLSAGTNNVNFRQCRAIEGWNGARNTEVKENTFTNYGYRAMWFGSGVIAHDNVMVGGICGIHVGNNWEQPETSNPWGSLSVHPGGITLCDIVGNYIGEGKNITAVNGAVFTGAYGIVIQNIAPGITPRPKVEENIITRSLGTGLNYGIYINGTGSTGAGQGCGVRGLTVRKNKVYKWFMGGPGQNNARPLEVAGWNINPTGTMIRDFDFLDNDLQEPLLNQGSILRVDSTVTDPASSFGPQYEGGFNRFWRNGNPDLYAVYPAGECNLALYAQRTGDVTSFETQVAYPFPNRTIGDYHGTLLGTATLAGYVAVVRGQSRANWNNDLMAPKFLEYVEAGFDA